MTLGPEHFGAFLSAVHGVDRPFPWQQALVDHLAATDAWPDVLDLPTGTGKTAAIDAAVFHLALRADRPSRAARRIAFVVDRRLVVDDAHQRAMRIVEALRDPTAGGVLADVRARLSSLSGGGAPLVAARLRGGMPLERGWVKSVSQPVVLCSTVDQIGSRLLFRGYGVSPRMAPVHAGLLGHEALILLDEAHLAEPFRQTLCALAGTCGARVRTALLSATPAAGGTRLGLTDADRADATLRRRLRASKPATLRAEKDPDFAGEARALMKRLITAGTVAPAVGVIVNRVGRAREIFEALTGEDGVEAILLTGRSRPAEREGVTRKLGPFKTGNDAVRATAAPLYVVATQCLEVGVDIDLDALVTEAAPLDALRQRFGRLNRAGRLAVADAAVLARASDVRSKADDPVYGDRTARTWEALTELATAGVVDFGVDALAALLDGRDVSELAAARPDAPVLLPAYAELWSQTTPIPAADPEVAMFLHGPERASAEVSIVWRADVADADLAQDAPTDLLALLALVPPRTAEALSVPIWAARRWLVGDAAARSAADLADAPAAEPEAEPAVQGRAAFRWAGPEDPRSEVVRDARMLRPGDTIVVPAGYGGCDRFGWAPGGEDKPSVADLADAAAWSYASRRFALRLGPDLAANDPVARARLMAVIGELGRVVTLDDLNGLERALPAAGTDAFRESVASLREALKRGRRIEAHFPYDAKDHAQHDAERRGVVLFAPRGLPASIHGDADDAATESDARSLVAEREILLSAHALAVAAQATADIAGLDLSEAEREAVLLAALHHDDGKDDPRFQQVLARGDPWEAVGAPLAKSAAPAPAGAWARAGLPDGWRHEALSVERARTLPALAAALDPGLTLWLIGAHHGLGRPFFGFADHRCDGPHRPGWDWEGRDWPGLFEELRGRVGPWRLAWLEAVVRLADHRASAGDDAPDHAEEGAP
jgi:CRISPR-associated endonuclease/helicase Cas3